MRIGAVAVALFVALTGIVSAQEPGAPVDQSLFPRPAALDDAVAFWTRVYTEVDSRGGFIHDSRDLAVVYETVHFGADASSRERRRITGQVSDKYRSILRKLGSGDRGSLSSDEARVLALFPAGTSDAEFRSAAERIRFQLGQSDRYRAGLIRSGRWKGYIESILEAEGLPRELAALPHVESSFDPTAYSKVGAAGMWQFTRSTGLRYMEIDHIVDERRDPFLSTRAAARLLKDNYSVIGSWPLALTAYNHGLAGMRRAVSQQGTADIGVIVEKYTSRTFGFASRNFYAAFLAALDVDRNAERYFGKVAIDGPSADVVVELPDYIDAAPLASALGVEMAELRRLNPALMDTVWGGDKYIPRRFAVRLPARVGSEAQTLIEKIPSQQRFAQQRPDLYHRVRSGDTLSGIAEQYGVSLAALVRSNGLTNRHLIRIGQQLTLPIADRGAVAVLASTNGANASLESSSEAPVSVGDTGEYVVRSGDSIERIANRFGVEQAELLRVNNVRNRNRIGVGQVLKIPGLEPAEEELAPEPRVPLVADALFVGPVADIEPQVSAGTIVDTEARAAEIVEAPGEDAEADLESNLLAASQANLAADPSDYSVAADDTIEVQAMETLGHYADWLDLRTQHLRDINGMPFGEAVVYGQRIKLDFSNVEPTLFEARRTAYQEQRQESFFLANQIADIVDHVIRPGESLWLLAQRTYKVPVWLLRQYNPDLDLDRVRPGTVVKFPRLEPITAGTTRVSAKPELG